MANERQVDYTISANDTATAVYKKWKAEVETGNKAISGSFVDAAGKVGQYGKEVNKVSEYVRTQRAEQRQQNFFINEARDAASAAALALTLFANSAGNSNATVKKLSDSLNAGIVAFQGINAVTSLLPGPWGLALSAVGALAVAIFRFNSDTKNTTEILKAQKEAVEGMVKGYEEWTNKLKGTEEANKALLVAEQALIKQRIVDTQALITMQEASLQMFGPAAAWRGLLDFFATSFSTQRGEVIASTETAKTALNELIARYQAVTAAANEVVVVGVKAMREPAIAFQQTTDRAAAFGNISTVIERQWGKSLSTIQMHVKQTAKFTAGLTDDIVKDMNEKAQATASFMGSVASVMGQTFTDMFSGSTDSAKAFIKRIMIMIIDMVQLALLAAAAATPLKGILSFGITAAPDAAALIAGTALLQLARAFVASFHTGGRVPKPGEGMTFAGPANKEFPVLVRGGETFRTERQEEDVQRRLNGGAGGITLIQYFNAPVDRVEWVKDAVEEGIRRTGLVVDQYFTDNRRNINLGTA